LDDQHLAEGTLERRIEAFKNEISGIRHNVNNAALVTLDPHNGEILALVGSADYFDESIHGALDMASSPRQTGSVFKPFIYALALDPTRSNPYIASIQISTHRLSSYESKPPSVREFPRSRSGSMEIHL
jgi:membrane carboxypeptidase/penicillin-binding protein